MILAEDALMAGAGALPGVGASSRISGAPTPVAPNGYTPRQLIAEYRRVLRLGKTQGDVPGRISTLGWDLEYPSPDAVLSLLDQIMFRRMNDFLPDNERPVILDCGANIGYTVLHYKRAFPSARITAFEPDPNFVGMLRRNLRRNDAADVTVVDAAAWIRAGRAPWVMEHKDGSRLATAASAATPSTDVATVDLATYLDGEIDLLKIDIEGAEFTVVPHLGDRLRHVKNILVECHVASQDDYRGLSEVMATLRSAGFSISVNSFGPWRDLTRRHHPEPLHAEQYFLICGWRHEHVAVIAEQTAAPYTGLGRLNELDDADEQLRRVTQRAIRTLVGIVEERRASALHAMVKPFTHARVSVGCGAGPRSRVLGTRRPFPIGRRRCCSKTQ